MSPQSAHLHVNARACICMAAGSHGRMLLQNPFVLLQAYTHIITYVKTYFSASLCCLPLACSGCECCVQVTDLMPGTTYEFRVMAINQQGGSPWSATGSASTLPSVPLPPPPPTISACSSHALHLTWREPYGQGAPVTSYTVNMARLNMQRPAANGHCRAPSLSHESDHSSVGGWRVAGKCAASLEVQLEVIVVAGMQRPARWQWRHLKIHRNTNPWLVALHPLLTLGLAQVFKALSLTALAPR